MPTKERFNLGAAIRAPWAKLSPTSATFDKVRSAWANTYKQFVRTATNSESGHSDMLLAGSDSDDRLLVAGGVFDPALTPVSVHLNANGLVVTQAVFMNPTSTTLRLRKAYESHGTAGNDAGAVTVHLTKEVTGQAPGAGVAITGTANLKGTANTVQEMTLSSNGDYIDIKRGERISVKVTGTTTNVAGVVITLYLEPGGKYDFIVYNAVAQGAIGTDQKFCIVPRTAKIEAIGFVGSAAGTDGGAVSLQVTLDTSTTAPGAGTDILTNNSNAGFNLKGTANTAQYGTFAATTLTNGQALSVDYAGTTTAVAGVLVVVALRAYERSILINYALNANGSQADQVLMIADRNYFIEDAFEAHSTAGSDGGSVNIGVEALHTTTAAGSGVAAIADNSNAGFNAKATANTHQGVSAMTAMANRYVPPTSRVGLNYAGTLTALAGVTVSVTLSAK